MPSEDQGKSSLVVDSPGVSTALQVYRGFTREIIKPANPRGVTWDSYSPK